VLVFQIRTRSITNRNKLLESKVIERTKDLDKTIKELNTEIASKDKFFSIISHDLRGPFNALLGFSNHLIDEIDFLNIDDIKTIGLNILKSTKVTYSLLENLLQWSRIQTGRITLEPEIINLKKIVHKIAGLYKNNIDEKNITLAIDVPAGIKILADLNMLETVLRNLLSNSIKFTGKGGGIMVSAKEDIDFVTISVSDTGVGISPDKIEKLFQIGQNISTLGTQNEKGSGLGLILCKEFIELNKGKLSITSKLGSGSQFKFTIPSNYLNITKMVS